LQPCCSPSQIGLRADDSLDKAAKKTSDAWQPAEGHGPGSEKDRHRHEAKKDDKKPVKPATARKTRSSIARARAPDARSHLDHIIVTAASLQEGVDYVRQALGVEMQAAASTRAWGRTTAF